MIVLLPPDPALYESGLARRLHQDTSGTLLAEYRQHFETCSLAAQKKLHAPLAREDFELNRAIVEGAATALAVIASVWEAMHAE
jgi:hypothetical protein